MTIRELEQFIVQYGKDIFSFCVHLTGNVTKGEELYQEVFFKAMDKLTVIRADANPKSYLLGMAVKLCHAEKRKAARRQSIVPITESDEVWEDRAVTSMEEQILEQEGRGLVQKAVRELPPKYKTVILLFYMEDMPLKEIAKVLEIPKGTVASRLHKAKDMLKGRLEGYYGEI